MNLASIAIESAGRCPDATAIRLGDRELSYADLDDRSGRVASLLRSKGLEAGDRVGIMLPNVPEFPIVYYGILRAGCIVVPMNVLLKKREIAFYLEDPGAKIVFAWHGFAGEAREGAETAGAEMIEVEPEAFDSLLSEQEPSDALFDAAEDDTAVILYTSGTTGQPKGAELSQSNLMKNCVISSSQHVEINEGDTVLGALPLFHSFGQTVSLNGAIRQGATLTMLPRFDPTEALQKINDEKVTHFQGVPTMYGAMLNHPERDSYDVSSLRNCMSGGAAMPVEVMRGFEEAFGCIILEGYGLSETSPVSSVNHPHMERKPGSIGTPIEGVEMKIVDESDNDVDQGEVGEIVIRGHNIMKGYWRRDDATKDAMRGGWFHSGDIGRMDEDGYFFIVDRKKDLIIRGGYNVYPREVEEVLYEHPKIQDAAVVGVPHDEWGEEIGAAIVLKPGEEMEADEVSAYVKDALAAYKYPRVVWFIDELPKGPTGKVLKREIEPPGDDS